MTYDNLLAIIADSSRGDWVCDEDGRRWTYTHDLMIRFEDTEPFGEGKDVRQEWAARVLGKSARSMCFTLYYGSSFVKDVHMAAVDDDRIFVPYPASPHNLVITRWQYRFAKIVEKDPHALHNLDVWLRQVGILI